MARIANHTLISRCFLLLRAFPGGAALSRDNRSFASVSELFSRLLLLDVSVYVERSGKSSRDSPLIRFHLVLLLLRHLVLVGNFVRVTPRYIPVSD